VADVAVVVGNHEGESTLGECLESLARQSLAPVEILVVDAASTDESERIASAHGARFVRRENRGLGHLYNEGARLVAAPYVLLANNDVSFDRSCLELLAAALDARPLAFAADPRQLDWDGSGLVHARVELRRGPLFRQPLPGFRLELRAPASETVPTVTANGGAMLVRRDRLLELGGFDETYFMDFEDIDLCWRAWLRGWSSVYVPDAWLRHRVGAATHAGVMTRRLSSSHHNLLRFALKCWPPREALLVALGEVLRLPRHPRLIAPALVQVVRELPEIMRLRRDAQPSQALMAWVLAGQPA
jgi:N-acetylglucosaminyl-diphospho-decaprenol L-rhamnosyltransferase